MRAAFAALLLPAVLVVAGQLVGAPPGPTNRNAPTTSPGQLTVVAEQTGPLEVYSSSEAKVKEFDRYDRYWDVDGRPGGPRTLLYVASERVPDSRCDWKRCTRNVVGRLNLTSGAHAELFSRTYSAWRSNEWHDADRVNATHVAVAGIRKDRVFYANVTTDRITWQWNAAEHYSRSVGGPEGDWTHLNDVEVLADGRVVASIRNMDEVVFVEPGSGVDEDWTLGSNGEHGVLHGQHNADYIPRTRGGPALIVADSHNNRIVEYQRRNGTWVQSWQWTDERMQWTRDGDRLPNGHTLITDTNGDRVFEVDERGRVVWSVRTTKAYEAERLGTGDESAGGESAAALGLPSRTGADRSSRTILGSVSVGAWAFVSDRAPPYLLNSLLFAMPPWVDPVEVLPLAVGLLSVVAWTGAELFWRVDRDRFRRG